MNLLQSFTTYISNQNLFNTKDKLLIATSGGVDSVVLCELCKDAGYNFAIAHCNFNLRGQESDRDEAFVKNLGEKYGVEVFVKKFDTEKYAVENKISIQVVARELRYSWFEEIRNSYLLNRRQGLQPLTGFYILTAHHADDNIETVLMNFFKGTGIQGLKGILPKQRHIIRPLLFASKDDIKNFATENNLSFVEDSSNELNKYTRNYFRNELIPGLQKVFPQVTQNLTDNINRFTDIEILYQQAIKVHKTKLIEQKGNEIHIAVLKLAKAKPLATIVYEIIKDFSFTPNQVNDVVNLLKAESGKYVASSTHRVIKNRNWLIIAPIKSEEATNILIENCNQKINYAAGKLVLQKSSTINHQSSTNTVQLDAKEITFPLLLRKWKLGDYFYPLGMMHKKKLNRFLIDNKVSLTDKENIWVIESNKKIIWVVGMRIDDRFKITEKTKEILEINYLPNVG
jgi:tRNA(Ile)-lysidine synthase